MIAKSLADRVLLAPEEDRANFMAHVVSAFGQVVLEKGEAIEGGSSATY